MKRLQKYFYWFVCTVVLAIIVLYGLLTATVPQQRFSQLWFSISSNAGIEEINIYEAEDGNSYVFLPSYANMEDVRVVIPSDQQFTLGGMNLSNGMTCETFMLETGYPLEINDSQKTILWFYQSANVATMYVDTLTGNMERIHEDKNYEEIISLTLYTVDGKINYISESNTLKGRGNATWGYDKRPYSLKLSSEADLLGMGTAENWVLLANAADETNLNNFLIYDLASRLGSLWTPECRYVDLYLNGEYSGLYLLAEKVEVGVERLNLDATRGDFLCKFDLESRWNTLRNPFFTKAGRTVELTYPESLLQTDDNNILSMVNQTEQIILSGTNLNAEKLIDLDSWVRRYLIDEISGNIDSDLASSYFYFSDGVCYAGPIWDYDMSLGNSTRNQEPNSFIAKNAKKSETFTSPYYSALYENTSFYNRMTEIYRTEFLPLLQQMLDGGIQNLSLYINKASQMNSIRWRSMFAVLQNQSSVTVRSTSDLTRYLDARVAFLNHAWLENVDYCTLQFELTPGGAYWNISIPKGSLLETSYLDLESTVWIDASTQEPCDFSQPIVTDLILSVSQEIEEGIPFENIDDNLSSGNLATRDYITFASIVMLGVLFLGIVCIDHRQRRQERRYVDENGRTKISP